MTSWNRDELTVVITRHRKPNPRRRADATLADLLPEDPSERERVLKALKEHEVARV